MLPLPSRDYKNNVSSKSKYLLQINNMDHAVCFVLTITTWRVQLEITTVLRLLVDNLFRILIVVKSIGANNWYNQCPPIFRGVLILTRQRVKSEHRD